MRKSTIKTPVLKLGQKLLGLVLGVALCVEFALANCARAQEAEPVSGVSTARLGTGLMLLLNYKADLVRNVRGGLEQGSAWAGVLGVGAEADLERALGWTGGLARVEVLAIQGTAPSNLIGDAQIFSNLQAEHGVGLAQAWLSQGLAEDRVRFQLGVQDLNNDFYFNEAAMLFVNGSFGLGAEVAMAGPNGAATFPYSALSATIHAEPVERYYLKAAAYDGVPGDPANLKGNPIELREGEGAFLVAEAGRVSKAGDRLPSKYAVGAWAYTVLHEHLFETDELEQPLRHRAYGAYVVAEQKLYEPKLGAARGLAGFARFGATPGKTSPVLFNAALGLVYKSAFWPAASDQLGFGVSVAGSSQAMRAKLALEQESSPSTRETVLELTYRASPLDWLVIQPDLQYILNAGFSEDVVAATVIGLRLEASL